MVYKLSGSFGLFGHLYTLTHAWSGLSDTAVIDLLLSLRRHQPKSHLFFFFFYLSSGRDGHDAQCLELAQRELTLLCTASVRSMSSWTSVLNVHYLSRTKWDGKEDGPNPYHILTTEGYPSK